MSTDLQQLKGAMWEIDQVSQQTAEKVRALCRAARACLTATPPVPLDAHDLLRTVEGLVEEAEHYINGQCEAYGAHFLDKDRTALELRLQPEALQGGAA